MSSTVYLYKNSSSRETVDKSSYLSQIESISGEYRGPVNVLNPVIQITPTTTTTQSKLLSECNYVYLPDLGRYYYVRSKTAVTANIIELELEVDVLYSFKTAILAQKVIVSRNEKDYSLYLDDTELKVYNNPNICTYNFKDSLGTSTGFTAEQFVMAVAGG